MSGVLSAVYLAAVSVAAVAMTVSDKIAAKHGAERVPERVLLFTGAIGGAAAMFVTMLLIRHKTKKPKFMISLPVLAVAHIALFALAVIFLP